MLTAVVFTPLAGALIILALLHDPRVVRRFAIAVILVDLAIAIAIFCIFDPSDPGLQLEERINWIPALKVQYFLAVDGLNAPFVLLTGILGMCAALASGSINVRVREYFVWLLVLQTALVGVFLALDFVLFFVFWELQLIPMYFLISIWGSGRKEYSAMKFLAFTILGSAFMLVGFLAIYLSTGIFDMVALRNVDLDTLVIPAKVIFFLLAIGFIVKLPSWPFHSWLPDAHTDAPTGVSVILAGVLIKMGGYGLIRVCVSIFPGITQDYSWLIVALGVISIIYGALVTLRQSDLKRLIAFSSISHMGLVLLGIASIGAVSDHLTSTGLTGAAMQMFTHGTITGLLFILVGVVYEKAHTRYIPDLGGLAHSMPFVCVTFVIAGLASLGLPGLSGFVSEILVFLGAFSAWPWPTAIAVFGIVLAAGYILWMIQRVFFGPVSSKHVQVKDIGVLEAIPVAVLVATIVVVGIYPTFLTDVFSVGVDPIIENVRDIAR